MTDGSKALNNKVNCFATHDTDRFPKSVAVDLEKVATVRSIGFGVPPYGSTKNVRVDVSKDGVNLSRVGEYSFEQEKEQWENLAVAGKQIRYVRLTFT